MKLLLQKSNSNVRKVLVYLIVIIMVVFLAWYISTFWFQLILIQGNSMFPTYHNFELAVLNKHFNKVDSGDVVAFYCDNLDSVLIKRVVAVPGQSVQIKDGTLYVDDIKSSLFPEPNISFSGIAEKRIILENDEYFVIGDNYDYSKDSRYELVGLIRYKSIIGIII